MAKASKVESTELISVEERIKTRMANINKSTQQAGGVNISLKGRIFKLPDGKTSPGPLNCIIIDYINKNMYYPETYVEGEFSEPICQAVHRNLEDMEPRDTVQDKQSPTCKGCHQNVFGSKGRGKACSNNVLLAILPEKFSNESELYTVKVSATGLTGWANFIHELETENKDPAQVITSLSFKKGVSFPTLEFKYVGGNPDITGISPFMAQADSLLHAD